MGKADSSKEKAFEVIHYHGTPCGGSRQEASKFLRGRHAFVPWVRCEDLPTVAEVCESFAFDNGAFTAWRSGNQITDWSGYYDWVEFWSRHPGFDWAVIPDVIDGTEAAQAQLLDEWRCRFGNGNIGVPVWHLHESLDRLEWLVNEYPRVALGSSGDWPNPGVDKWWSRMGEAMSVACDTQGKPKAKLHGLRMLSRDIFRHLPLSSADSTNSVRNANLVSRFGMYPSPNLSTRMATIAEMAEFEQSKAVWEDVDTAGLFDRTENELW